MEYGPELDRDDGEFESDDGDTDSGWVAGDPVLWFRRVGGNRNIEKTVHWTSAKSSTSGSATQAFSILTPWR